MDVTGTWQIWGPCSHVYFLEMGEQSTAKEEKNPSNHQYIFSLLDSFIIYIINIMTACSILQLLVSSTWQTSVGQKWREGSQ